MNVMESSPLDKPALVRYITLVLTFVTTTFSPFPHFSPLTRVSHCCRTDKNPFKHLLMKYVEKFVQKFVHPERSTIQDAKTAITVYLRRIYRSILSFFKEFSTPTAREILHLTVQVIFFAHTYGTISAIVKEKVRRSRHPFF
jgi:hypothetical protein